MINMACSSQFQEELKQLSNKELVEIVTSIQNGKSPNFLSRTLKIHHRLLFDEIVSRTKFLDKFFHEKHTNVPILARLYCLSNNLSEQPTCQSPGCSNPTNWSSESNSFYRCCSNECKYKDPERKKNIEDTNLKTIGVKNQFQSAAVKQRNRDKFKKSLGVDNPAKSPIVKRKMQLTCQAKFGHPSYAQSSEYHKNKKHKFESKKYPGLTFDSNWEVKVYEFCKDNNIPIEYSPTISYEYMYDGQVWTYHPDFLINGKIYEIKGDHFFRIDESGHEVMINPYRNPDWSDEQYAWICGKFEAKHQCMIANNVTILRGKDIENLNIEMFN